ncbi:TetR family transcriptional regulator [Actinocatenispora thailandica]|uniref:TetR family transcriptional regulator n=1 Tax=Actinocatenispora thailandica TaxID=227318 RepID=A0A7R7DMI0_9ACTN|nr:TetR/AcrR family transcriptional regulator [Actinocatenispora thailandica]BCJ34231.1 TetR family transcriptional regulator [Actinocatenispora thailandica]
MTSASERAGRRRGPALERAIHAAVLEELADVGYAQLAFDRVARRARLSRASLYRRWDRKADLVADALAHALPPLPAVPDTGNVRDDLLACFAQMHQLVDRLGTLAVQALAAELRGPADSALRTLLRDQVLEPRLQTVLDILLRAAARGEVRPQAATPVLARTGPALMFQHLLLYGSPPAHALVEDIVDRVVLPAATAAPAAGAERLPA